MSLEEIVRGFKCDKTILSMIYHVSLQRQHGENDIITTLNKTISLSKCRLKGLELLSANIKSLPTDVILQNAFFWLNICIGQHHNSLKEIKLTIIGKIIERVYEDQDFTKKLLSDYMTKILEMCLLSQANTYEIESALLVLSACMKRYGSWFGAHKSKIEIFLLNLLFSQSKNLVEKGAEAFLQIQQVGGAGVDGINHRSNFSSAFHKLCVTAQKLFDKLFENETEIEQYDFSNEEGYTLPESLNDASKVAMCLENCLTFIKIMMLKRFPEIKDIKPIEVLNIIHRGTALHLCLTVSEGNTLQEFQFATCLNDIQIKLIELLNVFIIWFQGNSLPFSYTISKILIDCLSRSQKCKCFKVNSHYAETVYTVFDCWLGISRCAFHVNFQTKLIDCILNDIIPIKNEIKLMLNNDKNAVSKSKRIQLKDSIDNRQNSLSSLSDSEIFQQHKICCAALSTLKHLFRSSWLRVSTEKLQNLYAILIGTTLEVITKKNVHPYTNLVCQEKLFDVLVTFYEESSLSVLPNINIALDILSKGRSNKNLKISSVCERGLGFLEILSQPICASLYSPENFSGQQFENILDIVSSEELPHSNIASDDPIDIIQTEQLNDESSSLEHLQPTENIDESFEEVCVENEMQIKDMAEHSAHILDVQILNPPIDKEFENVNIVEEVIDETETDKSTLLSSISADVSANAAPENINDYTASQVEEEEFVEPPAKIIKLEVKSEDIIEDEFVDQVKEY